MTTRQFWIYQKVSRFAQFYANMFFLGLLTHFTTCWVNPQSSLINSVCFDIGPAPTPLCHAGGSCLPLKNGRTASTGWIVLYQLLSCYKMGIFVNLTSLVFWATVISPIYTLDNKWDNKLILTTLRSLASCNVVRPSCKLVLKPHSSPIYLKHKPM